MRKAFPWVVGIAIAACMPPTSSFASGHGPVFGGATPTLGKGGWALDQAWMGHRMEDRQLDQLLRTMLSTGITEDVQMSVSLPIPLGTPAHIPTGRMMAMMSGHRDLESLVGWRFHRRAIGTSGRFESTAYVGGTVPLQDSVAGMATSPSASVAIATGYASRTHYVWLGAGYQRYAGSAGDRFGDVTFYSAVYGIRPKFLQFDYPKPDLRFFVEAVGENNGPAEHASQTATSDVGHSTIGHGTAATTGSVHTPTGTSRIFLVGPTALLLYKAYGISGGILFPVYQHVTSLHIEERFRFGINVSYFFWMKGD
jgi:hypothetical protein